MSHSSLGVAALGKLVRRFRVSVRESRGGACCGLTVRAHRFSLSSNETGSRKSEHRSTEWLLTSNARGGVLIPRDPAVSVPADEILWCLT
jgi:hypothetical protein